MMYSFEANANAVKISETVSVDTGQGAKIHKFVPKNSKTYSSDLIKTVDLTHIPTGAKARINAKITASVSRAGVLAGGRQTCPLRREIQHKGGSLCRNSPFSP
nr:IgG-binding virulence factor TspB family protein [Neisseria meningitidis]